MNHLIIDGHNLLFRCGHTTGHLTLTDGTPCGAAWGFLRSVLIAYRAELGATGGRVHVCWDGGRSPRRMAMLPGYKSNRRPEGDLTQAQEERQAEREMILEQIPLLQRLLETLGIYQYKGPGVEADDVVAALSETLSENPDTTVSILSGDEDFMQLVKSNVILVKPTGKRLFPEDVPRPSETVLLKCLSGCKSDCIPGFKGIGEITAQRFLDWLRSELGKETCLQLADIGVESILTGPYVVSPTGRVKTALKAFNGNMEILTRNYKLVCFEESLQWPEVWQTASTPWKVPGNIKAWQNEVRAMAWHSMEDLFPEAAAVSTGKGV